MEYVQLRKLFLMAHLKTKTNSRAFNFREDCEECKILPIAKQTSNRKKSVFQHLSMYQMRKIKNKGAITVLVWNFFVASVPSYLTAFLMPFAFEEATVALGLTLPLAGWLADIRFGRYKVIRWSM